LLNLLLGEERAIVSATPGTTRDTIEEVINLRGLPIKLVDTAGLRETSDEIEQAGIERTRQQLRRADLALEVVDGSQPRDAAQSRAMARDELPPLHVLILNKADLGEHASWSDAEAVRISCLNREGLDALADAIMARISGATGAPRDWSAAINARHQAALEKARDFAAAAREALTSGLSPEFVAEELRAAMDAVGEVVGRVDTEEILGRIFSTFCIGK
jgi:tRNA modification GTPase